MCYNSNKLQTTGYDMRVLSVPAVNSYSSNVVPKSVGSTRKNSSNPSFGYRPNEAQAEMFRRIPAKLRNAFDCWIDKSVTGVESGVPSDVVMDVELNWVTARQRAVGQLPEKVVDYLDRAVLRALSSEHDGDGMERVNNITRKMLHAILSARRTNLDKQIVGNA